MGYPSHAPAQDTSTQNTSTQDTSTPDAGATADTGITVSLGHEPVAHVALAHFSAPIIGDVGDTANAGLGDVSKVLSGVSTPSISDVGLPSADAHVQLLGSDVHATLGDSGSSCSGPEAMSYPADTTASIAAHADVPTDLGISPHVDANVDTSLALPSADVHIADLGTSDTSHSC